MNDYPEGLPLGRQADRSYKTVDPSIRSELESGRARQRKRFDFTPTQVAINWVFRTSAECQLFELWFQSDSVGANDGAEWFDIPLYTPLGLDTWRARFIGVYDGPKRVGLSQWQITANLELEERVILDPSWILLPDYVLHSDIFDKAMSREWPEA